MDISTPRNLGVIIESKPKDFVAGTLPYEVLNPSGDWTAYLPVGETQASHFADAMACVTFSCLNVIETLIKFHTGKEVNFSDRFIAKVSGTTQQGNSVQRVLDAINKYGLVLEQDWPAPTDFTWDTYYAEIPNEVYAKADKSIKVAYEFHYDDFATQLKQGPLEMILLKDNPYHSVEMVNTTQQFDSYSPYLRPQQSIYLATKIILQPMTNAKLIQIGSTFGYWFPATTPDGLKSHALNVGEVLPENADGSVDFTKLTPDYKIAS